MNKVIKRLCVFFIGVPLILFLVSFSYLNHFVIQLLIAIFSVLAGHEFYTMASEKGKPLFRRSLVLICIGLLQEICYLAILTKLNLEIIFWAYIFEILILLGFEALQAKSFEASFEKFTNSAFIILYCGFFITFISRITTLNEPSFMLTLFLIIVFMCDSGAWFFGVLFGKSTRGVLAASPNKSLVGFIGGIAASIASAIVVKLIFPDVFFLSYANLIIISLITSLSAIIGDLVESVIKRSLDCKDSGTLIPGRGGVLDSIDSLLAAAPVFYIAVQFLFK
ncbi:CDP-archaeol synthase [Treponema sp. C6A8]|uniref:CDP-archaeol synthase n=1 Tax=Treponema sp. C6A8 TaxID=1410609 RepID=UPI000481FC69|nr:CDP-archaeol synthase [Treponema sp. C6A8]